MKILDIEVPVVKVLAGFLAVTSSIVSEIIGEESPLLADFKEK